MIYLDNASTTKPYDECLEILNNDYKTFWGNPSNIYKFGQESAKILADSKKRIAQTINCLPEEIFFTSGSSEGNAWAMKQGRKVYCSPYEHPNYLENPTTVVVSDDYLYNNTLIPYPKQRDIENEFKNCVYAHMLCNNMTGQIFDVNEQFKIANYYNMFTVCDATQAYGSIHIDVNNYLCDMMIFSGHKFNCPRGIGFVYIKKSVQEHTKPLVFGTQQNGLRGGTESLPLIHALAVAAEKSTSEIDKKKVNSMQFKGIIVKMLNDAGIDFFIVQGKDTLQSTMCFCLKNVESEVIQMMLSDKNIYIGTSSACSDGSMDVNSVLKAMNVDESYIHGPIRLSFSLNNTEEEVRIATQEIIECYRKLVN